MRYDEKLLTLVLEGDGRAETVLVERLDGGTYDRRTDIVVRSDRKGEFVTGLHNRSIKEEASGGWYIYCWRACETGTTRLRVEQSGLTLNLEEMAVDTL